MKQMDWGAIGKNAGAGFGAGYAPVVTALLAFHLPGFAVQAIAGLAGLGSMASSLYSLYQRSPKGDK